MPVSGSVGAYYWRELRHYETLQRARSDPAVSVADSISETIPSSGQRSRPITL